VRTTEFYQEFSPDTPLSELPVVNKDTFRQHYDEFVSSQYKDEKDNRQMSTSGSTGTPLTMVQNRDKIAHNTAGGIFLSMVGGFYIGMKEAFIRVG
jgi:phenylacetate-CoA ligase